ncbi:glycosyltransferase family 4 protein [Vreelandella olivaria]|uniref:glycosyltransferase family 4 protein n=1 Tax=Vreelandella olivaria TaxID=390919 RepID=UPI00201FAB4B|nr:glycosyltransferase family 1 protein [Halomonas olivaria]
MNKLACIADHRWIGPHGIGRFATEVLSRLEYTPLAAEGNPAAPLDGVKSGMALRLKHKSANCFFTPGYNPPLLANISIFMTLHDLIHLDVEQESSYLKRAYYQKLILPAVKKAACVFTVSTYSKNRIVEWAGVDPDKIVVVGNGVDPIFTENQRMHSLGEPYFLYVGNQKPHKNIEFMIRAFAKSTVRDNFLLILSGRFSDTVSTLVDQLGIADRVRAAGFIEESDLPAWYRGASALIMPSLYEGFGLPVIEAMASNTLVLSSNRTSLSEVAGNAAHYFDPTNEQQLIEAFNFASNPENGVTLRENGIIQARKYNWDDVANKIKSSFSDFTR